MKKTIKFDLTSWDSFGFRCECGHVVIKIETRDKLMKLLADHVTNHP